MGFWNRYVRQEMMSQIPAFSHKFLDTKVGICNHHHHHHHHRQARKFGEYLTIDFVRGKYDIRQRPISVFSAIQLYSMNLCRCDTSNSIGLFVRNLGVPVL